MRYSIVSFARTLTLVAYLLLLLTLTLSITIKNIYPDTPRVILIIGLIAPLLFPLRGLLHAKRYTHAWSSFLSLLYVTISIDLWRTNAALSAALLLLTLLWFIGCILFARYCQLPWREQPPTHN